jgi:hypothetical protein
MELRLTEFSIALTQMISSLIQMWKFHSCSLAGKSADGTFQEFFNSIRTKLPCN